jgi:hypothetical protein
MENNSKKSKIYAFFTAMLMLCFLMKSIIDYFHYNLVSYNSAPFYVYILINCIYFIVTALIIFAVGIIRNKKKSSK